MNILVVEDEAALRNTLAVALTLGGHSVVRAENGLDGLARVDELLPDLVLLDLQMPEMDGWQFLRLFRSRPACKDVPVVVMSAARGIVADELPAQVLVPKPFDLDELLDQIEELAAARQAPGSNQNGPHVLETVANE